jgi:drug/metabolite transporter (DMT)-like permease
MTPPDHSTAENKPLGIILILMATVIFAFSDAFAKVMVARLPPIEVSWIRSMIVMTVTLPIAWHRAGQRIFTPSYPLRQLARGGAVMISSLAFLTGLSFLPLADASAINFIWPVAVTVFSVIFLHEKVGIRRWGATIVGFAGMLLIIRPGSSAFQLAALFPISAAIFWALASIMTRSMTSTDPPETTIIWSAMVMLAGTTIALPFYWIPPGWQDVGPALIVGIGSALGHALIVFAFQKTSASSLAPFAYLQLVWATLLGYQIFGTVPDLWVLAGAVLIALSGLYTAHRERVRAREAVA